MNSARFSWVVFALIVSAGAQAAGHEALGLPDSAVVEQVLHRQTPPEHVVDGDGAERVVVAGAVDDDHRGAP